MREKLSDYQELYGDLYNLEATPAESTAYRLAKHDKEKYPGIITASEEGRTPYYTNSSHLPVGYTDDIFAALDIQDQLQTLYTSGTVFHAFLGEKLPNWKSCMNLVRKIAENYHLPYYTMSPTYSVCKEHGYITGEQYICPKCGARTEVYSRITGYYRPVQNWNDGKSEEFQNRKTYDLKHSKLTHELHHHEEECECCEEPAITETLLFGTKTCPNCKMAKMMLDKAGIKYVVIDAEDNKEETISFGVKKAPTLLVPNADSYDVFENASNIKRFIEEHK
jgi:ribonucleoside-triphosphate reductase